MNRQIIRGQIIKTDNEQTDNKGRYIQRDNEYDR